MLVTNYTIYELPKLLLKLNYIIQLEVETYFFFFSPH